MGRASTRPSLRPSSSNCRGRSTAGGRRATRSTPRCAPRDSIRSSARSPSPTAHGSSTPRCSPIPLVGFLPADDPRVTGTVAAIERELLHDGFVLRYRTDHVDDGLPPGEGVFLACSFWLVDVYLLQGRVDEAAPLFERLAGLANDVGLFSEEYDPAAQRQLGNFPQAFTHLAFVRAAANLAKAQAKATAR